MDFAELEKTNVTKHIEKKGRFSYLSWPFAVSEFRKACPNGTWRPNRFNDLPYQKTDTGAFVSITVWPDVDQADLNFEQIHPVLNHQNKPILEPNPFEINSSIQRCLVKAIAIATGIGLHIYAGEDLPPSEDADQFISGAALEVLKTLANRVVTDWESFLKVAQATSIDTIPARNFQKLMGLLNKKLEMERQPGEDDE